MDNQVPGLDILTDTLVWLVERGADLTLAFGQWATDSSIGALDWASRTTISTLQLTANLIEWMIENPWKALRNLTITVVVVLLVLMILIYFYDLIIRRNAAYRARMSEGRAGSTSAGR